MSAGNNISAKSKRGTVYLTKRILVSTAHKGGRLAAKKAMDTMGYIIVEILHAIPYQNDPLVID